jgi:ABC-type lipoprotein release transport system permease subunit
MAEPVDLSPNVANIMLSRTLQVGGVVETNAAEINKLLTFDHLENKRMVSLQSALGAREVQAKVTPGGPSQAKTD